MRSGQPISGAWTLKKRRLTPRPELSHVKNGNTISSGIDNHHCKTIISSVLPNLSLEDNHVYLPNHSRRCACHCWPELPSCSWRRIVGVPGVAEWLDTIWHARPIRKWIEQIAASSAGRHNVSVGRLNKSPVPLPPSAEQRRIAAKVQSLFAQADTVEREVVHCEIIYCR